MEVEIDGLMRGELIGLVLDGMCVSGRRKGRGSFGLFKTGVEDGSGVDDSDCWAWIFSSRGVLSSEEEE